MRRGSDAFEQIIAGSHVRTVRMQALRGSIPLGFLDVSAASLSISGDASTITRRTLNATVAATTDALNWFRQPSTTVKAWVGAQSSGRTEWMPVHWGVSQQPQIDEDGGTIQFSSPDLAQRIADSAFINPEASNTALTVPQQIESLVREAIPWMNFRDETNNSTAVAAVTWTDSRADAIAQLAQSVAAESFFSPVMADGNPGWVVRPERTLASLPDFQIVDGVNLSAASESVDFTKCYNVVIASADRSDGGSLQGVSIDTDPSSPLNVADCGYKVGRISSSLYTTQTQCMNAAYAARMRLAGYPSSLSVDSALHPGVDCGDLWVVMHNRKSYRVIPTSIDFDLFTGAMSASCRAATMPQPGVS